MRTRTPLFDERLRWHPRDVSRPFTLGEALCEVGPGWWPLVRRAFAAAAETPGTVVADVRQKHAMLAVWLWHDDTAVRQRLADLAEAVQMESAARCEACGTPVPSLQSIPLPRPTRNHCGECASRLDALYESHGMRAERALWIERAGTWLPEWPAWGNGAG